MHRFAAKQIVAAGGSVVSSRLVPFGIRSRRCRRTRRTVVQTACRRRPVEPDRQRPGRVPTAHSPEQVSAIGSCGLSGFPGRERAAGRRGRRHRRVISRRCGLSPAKPTTDAVPSPRIITAPSEISPPSSTRLLRRMLRRRAPRRCAGPQSMHWRPCPPKPRPVTFWRNTASTCPDAWSHAPVGAPQQQRCVARADGLDFAVVAAL